MAVFRSSPLESSAYQEHETPYKMRRASWVSPIHPAGSQAAIVSHNWCISLIHANETNRLSSQ